MPTHTSLPFFKFGFAGSPQNQTRKKGIIHFIRVTPDGASLVRGYYPIVPPGLQFGSLCSHSWRTSGLRRCEIIHFFTKLFFISLRNPHENSSVFKVSHTSPP